VYGLWSDFEEGRKAKAAILDLREVQFIDAEGVNFLALLTAVMRESGTTLSVKMPKSASVSQYIEYVGLAEYLGERTTVSSDRVKSTIVDEDGRLIKLLSNRHKMCFVRPGPLISALDLRHFEHIITRGLARAASNCLMELIDNIFGHSGQTMGCITIQTQRIGHPTRDTVVLAVTDIGLGIPSTVRREYRKAIAEGRWSADQRGLPEDQLILEYALRPGVSGTGVPGRGYGLFVCCALARNFRVSSGNGGLSIMPVGGDRADRPLKRVLLRNERVFVPGTSIVVVIDPERIDIDFSDIDTSNPEALASVLGEPEY
jgi:hypothetical protein